MDMHTGRRRTQSSEEFAEKVVTAKMGNYYIRVSYSVLRWTRSYYIIMFIGCEYYKLFATLQVSPSIRVSFPSPQERKAGRGILSR